MQDQPLQKLPADTTPLLRLNRICPYYTMFPLRFPFNCLAQAEESDWVLDPFCGRGTSNFAARLRHLPSVGIDGNPVAAAIASAKLIQVRPGDIIRSARCMTSSRKHASEVPTGEFWELAYHPRTLNDICKIRQKLLESHSCPSRVALRALMLGILHGPVNKGEPSYLSNQMPRTYATKPKPAVRFWCRHRLKPRRIDVLDVVSRRARFSFASLPPSTRGEIILGDSRSAALGRRRFRWVITSPPYYGMRSYIPDQWLRNWFLGGPADVDYSTDRQISHSSEDEFVTGLAKVWRKVGRACLNDAHLIVRFGALSSRTKIPRDIITRSLSEADCGWRIVTIKNAGNAMKGRRQYDQFGPSSSDPVEELDLYGRLEA